MHRQTATRSSRRVILSVAAACLLVACGGAQIAGIQGSGSPVAAGATSVGPISGFGSIILDGVEYATAGAQIRIDDQPGTESQLRVGQIVTIKGSVNADGTTGTATDVSFTGDLRGSVTQVDLDGGTFTILGQTVRVTDATLFDESIQPAELSGLQVGAVVQVSGFANAEGALIASRVDPATAAAGLQVRGTVQGLDAMARTFRINTLTVDYNGVMPTGTLTNAATVSVAGTTLARTGALIATRVQVSAGSGAAANDRGQLEGIVTSFVSKSDFVVNGQRVLTDNTTEFVLHGATLGLDVPVKVRGTFNASGVLVASEVEVKPQSLSVVRGLVDAVSATGNTLTVLGVSVTTSSLTSFEDESSQQLRSFGLADVRSGDYVEVRGTPNPSGGGLVAILVERDTPENRSYLQGVAVSVAIPNFTVLGITVVTDAQTHFTGPGGQGKAAGEFFREAQDQVVKVRGTLMGSVFIADQAQIRH
jgi:hypothetical protein